MCSALGIDLRLSGLATSHLVSPYWWSSAWLYQKTCSKPTAQFFSILYPFKLCSLVFQNRDQKKGAEGRCKGNGHAEELRRGLQSQTRATAPLYSCFVLSMFVTIISSTCSAMALWSGSVEPLRVLCILLPIILLSFWNKEESTTNTVSYHAVFWSGLLLWLQSLLHLCWEHKCALRVFL